MEVEKWLKISLMLCQNPWVYLLFVELVTILKSCSQHLFSSSHFSFLVYGHFWRQSYENTKILRNLLCSSSHIQCLEIFDEPRNCCRTWNTLVFVFLNCSCEIDFRAPSRYRKGCVIIKEIFQSDSFFFLTQQKI